MEKESLNIDPQELDKFEALAHKWWDADSEFKSLHDINPIRLNYIDEKAALKGKSVLDVGCAAGGSFSFCQESRRKMQKHICLLIHFCQEGQRKMQKHIG